MWIQATCFDEGLRVWRLEVCIIITLAFEFTSHTSAHIHKHAHTPSPGDREVNVIRSCHCGSSRRCRKLRKTVVYILPSMSIILYTCIIHTHIYTYIHSTYTTSMPCVTM